MKTTFTLAFCGLIGLASILGCGGPDPSKDPKFNKDALENPSAVKVPMLPPPGGGGPGGPGPAPGATK